MNGDVLILSGAGLSAESGISTFRDNGGFWHNYNVNPFLNDQNFTYTFYERATSAAPKIRDIILKYFSGDLN